LSGRIDVKRGAASITREYGKVRDKSWIGNEDVTCAGYGERARAAFALMSNLVRKAFSHPMLALGSTLLWGIVEFGALVRSRWARTHKA
jgi:hypothetical protein